MPTFSYQGVDRAGKKVSGSLEVTSEGDLRVALRGQGIRPTKIAKGGGGTGAGAEIANMLGGGNGSVGRVPLAVIMSFSRQLQVLISSGIPVVQALDVLSEQAVDRNMKRAVTGLKEKVSGGAYLWEAMATYNKVFPKIYIALIRAGESSGSVDQMLKRLCRYLEDAERLRKIIKSAMMYPIIVISIGILVVGVMMVYVIPKFEELLSSNGQELPGPTLFVMNVSHFMVRNILYIVGGTVLSITLLTRWAQSEEGKAVLDRMLFKAPMFGNLMQKAGIARFSRTMQTLLASGVNLIDAIDICKQTIANAVLEESVGKIRTEVESGKTLGQVIGKLTVFPRMAAQMISVGESTGNLDKMLEKVADFYEEEVETLVGGLTKLIEPIVLVVLGSIVGGLMIAMYLPIFKMAGGVN
jgi:type IV pilus assembly protein PilC